MTDDPTGALLEHIDDQLKAIAEGQAAMAGVPGDIQALKEGVAQLNDKVDAIHAAVTDQTAQLNDHEVRIHELEGAA